MSACPKCRIFGSECLQTRRLRNGWIKRWRHCMESECEHRWQTLEVPVVEMELDTTSDGLKEIVLRKGKS